MLFLLSGALGLGYQVVWSRVILDFIGVSSYSYTTVLAAFMGGLAIGSRILGKWADKVESPLKLYGWLELAIALYAAVYLPLNSMAKDGYATWIQFDALSAGEGYGLFAKVVVSGALLLPPTFLMGGTYPLLVKHVTPDLRSLGKRAAQLYSVNALGAVIGSLAAAVIFLPQIGVSRSLLVFALLNACVGLVALGVATWSSVEVDEDPASPHVGDAPGGTPPMSRSSWLVHAGLLLICLEGVLAFSYEIVWTRYFGVVLGSSTYSFAIMLSAFIAGIALGGALLSRFEDRITDPMNFFGWTFVGASILVTLLLPLYPYAPWLFNQIQNMLSTSQAAYPVYEASKFLLCFLVMLGPTVFMGMALPLVVDGLGDRLQELGTDTGRVYAWNTVGNVVGAVLGGFVLLPWLGMENMLRGLVTVGLILGVITIMIYSPRRNIGGARGRVAVSLLAICTLLWTVGFSSWNLQWFTLMPFRRHRSSFSIDRFEQQLSHRKPILSRDDPAGHLLVTEDQRAIEHRTLYVNGKADATSVYDLPTQLLLGHFPMLFHPNPSNVMLVGLASGVSADAVLSYDVPRLDVVEIIRAMPEATRKFDKANNSVLDDPGLNLIFDDALSYVSYTREDYDVIISEPSNPWTSGSATLFTREFYQQVASVLRPQGMFVQWLQTYEISDSTLSSVILTLRSVFPYLYGFNGTENDLIVLASFSPLQPDWKEVAKRVERPKVRDDLRRAQITDLSSLLYMQRFGVPTADFLAAQSEQLNTLDNHFLEYQTPIDLFMGREASRLDSLDARNVMAPNLLLHDYLETTGKKFALGESRRRAYGIQLLPDHLVRLLENAHSQLSRHFGYDEPLMITRRLVMDPPPETPTELVAKIDDLRAANRTEWAEELLNERKASILLQSFISKEARQFWGGPLQRWANSGTVTESSLTEFEKAWVEWLVAIGEVPYGKALLARYVQEGARAPREWIVLQSCRVDPGEFCGAIKRSLERPAPRPVTGSVR